MEEEDRGHDRSQRPGAVHAARERRRERERWSWVPFTFTFTTLQANLGLRTLAMLGLSACTSSGFLNRWSQARSLSGSLVGVDRLAAYESDQHQRSAG